MSPETATNVYLGLASFIALVVLPLVAAYFQHHARKREWESWLARLETLLPTLDAEAKSYFENRLRHAHLEKFDRAVISAPGFEFFDARSKKELLIERDAQDGRSLGKTFDGLVAELHKIGKYSTFTTGTARSDDHENGYNKRARLIGDLLHRAGGLDLMQAAYYRVKLSGGDARDLERCWDGIGFWSTR